MVRVHGRYRHQGPPRFGGRLRPGDEVLHLVSDAPVERHRRAPVEELEATFVAADERHSQRVADEGRREKAHESQAEARG